MPSAMNAKLPWRWLVGLRIIITGLEDRLPFLLLKVKFVDVDVVLEAGCTTNRVEIVSRLVHHDGLTIESSRELESKHLIKLFYMGHSWPLFVYSRSFK